MDDRLGYFTTWGSVDKCSFYMFFCSRNILIFTLVACFLLSLPFSYTFFKLLRRIRLKNCSFNMPGLGFCGAKIIQSISYIFSMVILRTIVPFEAADTPAKLHSTFFSINAYALSIYCTQISQILIALGLKFGKSIYYTCEAVKYYFMLMLCLGTIFTFVEFKSSGSNAYVHLFRLVEANRIIQSSLYALSVILLGVVFVFSNVSGFLSNSTRKYVRIVMFSFCFFYVIGSILFYFDESVFLYYYIHRNPNAYNWAYVILEFIRYFLPDLNILFLINLLGASEDDYMKEGYMRREEEIFSEIKV